MYNQHLDKFNLLKSGNYFFALSSNFYFVFHFNTFIPTIYLIIPHLNNYYNPILLLLLRITIINFNSYLSQVFIFMLLSFS